MWSRIRALCVVCAVVAVLISPRVSAQKADMADVLKNAAKYVTEFSEKLQAVTAEEVFLQMDTSGNKVNVTARIGSDVVMLGLPSGNFFFRDVYSVDTKPTGPREGRLLKLFQSPPDGNQSIAAATKLNKDGGIWFVTRNFQILDSPLMTLELLREPYQAGSVFTLDSVKKTDGVDVAILKFKETRSPSVLGTPVGIPVSGRLWVEAVSGTLRQAEIVVSDKAVNARYSIKYKQDKGTGFWLPAEMDHMIQISATVASGSMTGVAGTGSYEGHIQYSKFKQVPVDKMAIR